MRPGNDVSDEHGTDEPDETSTLAETIARAAGQSGLGAVAGGDAPTGKALFAAMGGVRGLCETILPGLVFLIPYTVLTSIDQGWAQQSAMPVSLGASVVVAVVFTLIRVITKTQTTQAIAGLIGVAASAILVSQLEIPLDTVTAGAKIAAAAGVPVLLNPSPARELPAELLAAVTVLVVNEGEAAVLGEAAVAGVPHVVTTLGSAGARYRGPSGIVVEVPAPTVRPVDTTGAGDAFAGALAVAWAEGAVPELALRRACAAGALAFTGIAG